MQIYLINLSFVKILYFSKNSYDLNELELQKDKILKGSPKIEITKSCMIDDGIIRFKNFDRFKRKFEESDATFSFFIPASGSGSRMFQFLYDFLGSSQDIDSGMIELFVNKLEEFAFFNVLPEEVKQKIKQHDFDIMEIVDYVVQENGLGYGSLPKALIPFHKFGPFVINPVQEHVIQGFKLGHKNNAFHFTVSEEFIVDFKSSINSLQELIGSQIDYSFSIQNPDTHSIVFDDQMNVVENDSGEVFRRPSGHGALIENLNEIKSDIVFIKNIDNVQHQSNSKISKDGIEGLSGLLIVIKDKINDLLELTGVDFKANFSIFNKDYQLFENGVIDDLDEFSLKDLLRRPLRVCGMVRNEGQPGGGPFWVRSSEGILSKQIVEKSQIDLKSNQFKILAQSTHFNPVFMALSMKDSEGVKFDLKDYVNKDEYFVVRKSQKGKSVQFIERPGLWNGGMYHWNSVFVELDPKAFTPVKTVLDLLKPLHF